MSLRIGMTGTHRATVPQKHTAEAFGNPGVRVLATPMLILYCEMASHDAIVAHLDDGQASVGIHNDNHHLAATPVGGVVTVEATLTAIDGRRLTFAVAGRDQHQTVCRGTHTRVVVDLARFLAGLGR